MIDVIDDYQEDIRLIMSEYLQGKTYVTLEDYLDCIVYLEDFND